jgi:MHS family shikimate/dehydroshikimate transporter-like MFS transporter
LCENGIFSIFTVFGLAYGEDTLTVGKSTILTCVAIAAAIGLLKVPLWRSLSDRFGSKPMYLGGAMSAGRAAGRRHRSSAGRRR